MKTAEPSGALHDHRVWIRTCGIRTGAAEPRTSQVEVGQVVGDRLVQGLLGAELHAAGKQNVPFPAGQSGMFSEPEGVRPWSGFFQTSGWILQTCNLVLRGIWGQRTADL